MPTSIDVAIYDCWNVDRMSANGAQAEYDALKARVRQLEARVNDLENCIDTVAASASYSAGNFLLTPSTFGRLEDMWKTIGEEATE